MPRLWPGSTVVCIATGPSLVAADVDACRGRAKVVAVKDAVRLAPWADVLYGAGADTGHWWAHHGPLLTAFAGLRYTLDPKAATWATVLRYGPVNGLTDDPGALALGGNSGYQAINLAVHLGAARIVLLGYDLQLGPGRTPHFFGRHPYRSPDWNLPCQDWPEQFATLAAPLAALGIRVVNATPTTRLTAFPRVTLAEALA